MFTPRYGIEGLIESDAIVPATADPLRWNNGDEGIGHAVRWPRKRNAIFA